MKIVGDTRSRSPRGKEDEPWPGEEKALLERASAAAFLSGPAFAFSGITFPVAAMPLAAQTWSALIPLTHYLRVMVDQAMRGAPLAVSSLPLAALAAFVLLLPVASLGRLRRVATDERFWGRL